MGSQAEKPCYVMRAAFLATIRFTARRVSPDAHLDAGMQSHDGGTHLQGHQAATASTQRQNPRWLAPEFLSQGHLRTINADPRQELEAWKRGDVFSFGVIMWELATLEAPWQGWTDGEIEQQLIRGDRLRLNDNLEDDDQCPAWDEYKQLMEECCNENPEKRPCFKDIRQHVEQMKACVTEHMKRERSSESVRHIDIIVRSGII